MVIAAALGLWVETASAASYRGQLLELPSGGRGVAVRVADATSDGRLDVLVGGESSSGASGAVWIFAGDGTGGFAALTRRRLPSGVADIAVAELTGDGHADVAAVLWNRIVVLTQDGGAVTTRLRFIDQLPSAMALADVDRDGNVDALVDTAGERGRVLLGDGRGRFRPAGRFPAAACVRGPGDILVEDVNRDGLLDTVTSDFCADEADIGLGIGEGIFRTGASLKGPHYAVALGHLDADPWLDAVGSGDWPGSGMVRPFLGRPGGWQARSWWVDRRGFFDLAITDADGDGTADVVASQGSDVPVRFDDRGVTVLSGDGAGGFARQLQIQLPLRKSIYDLAVGDLDSDGRADAAGVLGADAPGQVAVLTSLRTDEPLRAVRLTAGDYAPRSGVTLELEITEASRVTVEAIPSRPATPARLARLRLPAGIHIVRARLPSGRAFQRSLPLLRVDAQAGRAIASIRVPVPAR